MENLYNSTLKTLRSDKGGEFMSKEFSDYCDSCEIRRQLSAPYIPQQNGVAKTKNMSVIEMAGSMLKSKELPNNFLAEAVSTAIYLLNISPTKALKNITPFQAWKDVKPSIKHLRVFGSIGYTLIQSPRLQKI